MRLSIIKEDGTVCIDGECITKLDLSFLPSDFHALQWYDTHGDLETRDPITMAPANTLIYSIAEYQPAIDAWNAAKTGGGS